MTLRQALLFLGLLLTISAALRFAYHPLADHLRQTAVAERFQIFRDCVVSKRDRRGVPLALLCDGVTLRPDAGASGAP